MPNPQQLYLIHEEQFTVASKNVVNVQYSASLGKCQPVGQMPLTLPVKAGFGEVELLAPFWYCTASAHWYKPP